MTLSLQTTRRIDVIIKIAETEKHQLMQAVSKCFPVSSFPPLILQLASQGFLVPINYSENIFRRSDDVITVLQRMKIGIIHTTGGNVLSH